MPDTEQTFDEPCSNCGVPCSDYGRCPGCGALGLAERSVVYCPGCGMPEHRQENSLCDYEAVGDDADPDELIVGQLKAAERYYNDLGDLTRGSVMYGAWREIERLRTALGDLLPLAEFGFEASEGEECCSSEYGCGCRARCLSKINRAGELLYCKDDPKPLTAGWDEHVSH